MAVEDKSASYLAVQSRHTSSHSGIVFLQAFLIGVGVSLYLMDVGLDVNSCIRWATMNGCFRLLLAQITINWSIS